MTSREQAAAARAAAAKKADAVERLSALEVERRGYVRRGDSNGVSAVDDEIAHWSSVLGVPTASGAVETGTEDETRDEGQEGTQEPNTPPEPQEPTGDENGPKNGESEPEQPKARRSRAKAAAAPQES